jgi:FlaA1/EpsC-like NDP-sugar epimerase
MKKNWKNTTRNILVRRAFIWAAQIIMFALSGLAAFLLRFDFSIPQAYLHQLAEALAIWIGVKTIVFRIAKLDRGLWHFVSLPDIVRVGAGNLAGSAISFGLIEMAGFRGFPRSVFVLDAIVCFLTTCGVRMSVRILLDLATTTQKLAGPEKRALIYGAGHAGVALAREIHNNPKLNYELLGFIDDDPNKLGMRLAGLPLMGNGTDLDRIARKHRVDVVLISVPSATGAEMTQILSLCHAAGVDCRTVPGLGELIEGGGLASQIREVAVEDLLGRTPVHLEESRIRSTLEGKTVLVTGAAGSIGSEMCRQIARFRPAAIVGFEIAESPLFEIDREMRQVFPNVLFHAEIGSIQNRKRLDEVFNRYRPAVVYHAAAYKHVPLMEEHVFEAVENNVFGTYNLARAAARHGVESLVMISTDKAVRPTNVMGATKRAAELLLLHLQNGGTQYIAVRFGNVLGSNGSVIPIFRKQIASGGPVTVTHPEMRRFFMTIPEAAQLVLQASAICEGGQVCVLDMGQPVKIVELARKLILLSGLKPDEDIAIEFTGIRPGEKLYEELSTILEDTLPTSHEKVRIFVGNGVPDIDLDAWLDSVREICCARDVGRLVIAMKEMVRDYNPSVDLLRRFVPHETADAAFLASD